LDEDPVFQKFSHSPKVVELLKGLGAKHPQISQAMYICKQPKIGGVVSIHQDSTFVNTKPLTCFALWFAVEEVKKENGCLWVVPKSHTSTTSFLY
jgi:phytanoyl-CoA hydroxylase